MKPKRPVPSTQKRLGKLIWIYRDRQIKWRDFATTFIPASLAVLAPTAYGHWRIYYANINYGPAAAQAWGWPWFALSAVALIPYTGLLLLRVRRAHRLVAVFKNGLLIRGTRGFKRILFWREISAIAEVTLLDRFMGITLRKIHRATLFPNIGEPLNLDHHLPGLAELCSRIKGKIYPRLLPELRSALAAGKQLYFGPLTVQGQEIGIRGRKIPWDTISQITVQNGTVTVKSGERGTTRIPVGEIPNVELFIQIIQEGIDA